MKIIENANNKIHEKIKTNISKLKTDFNSCEEEILKLMVKDLKASLKSYEIEITKIDNPHLDLVNSVTTQTSIEEKSTWKDQKIAELNEKLEKRINELNELIAKIPKLNKEYTEEIEALKAEFAQYKTKNMEGVESIKLMINQLKNNIAALNNKLLPEIKEIKKNESLLNDLWELELLGIKLENFLEQSTVDEKTNVTLELIAQPQISNFFDEKHKVFGEINLSRLENLESSNSPKPEAL